MKNDNLTKIYKVDVGSKIFFFFLALFFLIGITLTFNEFSLLLKILLIFVSFLFLYGFWWSLKYKVTIAESSMTIEFSIIPCSRIISQEIVFKEISRVYDMGLLFDDHIILLYYGYPKKKTAFIPVGLGFPWEILNDVVTRLPASAQIDFDPYLWKRLKSIKPVSAKKLIILAIFLVLLISFVAWYFWPK